MILLNFHSFISWAGVSIEKIPLVLCSKSQEYIELFRGIFSYSWGTLSSVGFKWARSYHHSFTPSVWFSCSLLFYTLGQHVTRRVLQRLASRFLSDPLILLLISLPLYRYMRIPLSVCDVLPLFIELYWKKLCKGTNRLIGSNAQDRLSSRATSGLSIGGFSATYTFNYVK